MGKPSLYHQLKIVLEEVNLTDSESGKRDFKYYDEVQNDEQITKILGKSDFKKIEDDKGNKASQKYIFSYNGMKTSNSLGKVFVNWLKENTDVRMLSQIKEEDAIQFLTYKRDIQGLTPDTIKTYKYVLNKISEGIQAKGWTKEAFYTENVRDFYSGERIESERKMTNQQVREIIQYSNEKEFKWSKALEIQAKLGLRVSELCNLKSEHILDMGGTTREIEGTKWGTIILEPYKMYVQIKGKGGLIRWTEINPRDYSLFRQLKEETDGKIFKGLTRNKYDKFLGRLTEHLFDNKIQASHEIRKYYASEQYFEKLEQAREEKQRELTHEEKSEIALKVCRGLGHGDRKDLVEIYIYSSFK